QPCEVLAEYFRIAVTDRIVDRLETTNDEAFVIDEPKIECNAHRMVVSMLQRPATASMAPTTWYPVSQLSHKRQVETGPGAWHPSIARTSDTGTVTPAGI